MTPEQMNNLFARHFDELKHHWFCAAGGPSRTSLVRRLGMNSRLDAAHAIGAFYADMVADRSSSRYAIFCDMLQTIDTRQGIGVFRDRGLGGAWSYLHTCAENALRSEAALHINSKTRPFSYYESYTPDDDTEDETAVPGESLDDNSEPEASHLHGENCAPSDCDNLASTCRSGRFMTDLNSGRYDWDAIQCLSHRVAERVRILHKADREKAETYLLISQGVSQTELSQRKGCNVSTINRRLEPGVRVLIELAGGQAELDSYGSSRIVVFEHLCGLVADELSLISVA